MKTNTPPSAQKHFLRQLFEEGVKNLIRLFIGILLLFFCYFILCKIYEQDEDIFFSCELSENAQNFGSEGFYSQSIFQGIENIFEKNRAYSARELANLATCEGYFKNSDVFNSKVYDQWSITKIFQYFGIINKYINCSISLDSSGYACTIGMTNKKYFDKKKIHYLAKIYAKNLNSLFEQCAKTIVEYYEPKLLPAYLLKNGQFDIAEDFSEKLLRSPQLLQQSFEGKSEKDFSFLMNQIYVNVLIEKYKDELQKYYIKPIDVKIKSRLNALDNIAQKSSSKIDKASSQFVKGTYHLAKSDLDSAVTVFYSSVQFLNSIHQKSDTTRLTLARVLNNYAYSLYKNGDIAGADMAINNALSQIDTVRRTQSSLSSIDQVYGLCLTTKCEILWKQRIDTNIIDIRTKLIEAKHYDKTFKFSAELFKSDPIYKDILRAAQKDEKWKKFMTKMLPPSKKTDKQTELYHFNNLK